jgi:hypothetical protein
MSLQNVHPEFEELLGIMETNGKNTARGGNSQHTILCLNASRFNHSCMPNADYVFSVPYERVFAIRNIKMGDELCVSYVDLANCNTQPTIETARKYLKIKFGFDCMCEVCAMKDEKERNKIERYRVRYWELGRKISTNLGLRSRSKSHNANLLLALVQEMFEVMEKAKLLNPLLIPFHAHDGFLMALACQQPSI